MLKNNRYSPVLSVVSDCFNKNNPATVYSYIFLGHFFGQTFRLVGRNTREFTFDHVYYIIYSVYFKILESLYSIHIFKVLAEQKFKKHFFSLIVFCCFFFVAGFYRLSLFTAPKFPEKNIKIEGFRFYFNYQTGVSYGVARVGGCVAASKPKSREFVLGRWP